MQHSEVTVDFAKDFTTTPGPRCEDQDTRSGEEFLKTVLAPKFQQAVSAKAALVVNLDGIYGDYSGPFLQEAFGGLARRFGSRAVLDRLKIKSDDQPELSEEIRRMVVAVSVNETSAGPSQPSH